MRKRRAIEHRYLEAETSVGDIDDVSLYENAHTSSEPKDKVEMEKLIYFLTAEEITVLLLKHLGYNSKEICKIMGLKSMKNYYGFYHNMKMRIYLFKNLRIVEDGKKH
jgi:DNA-directed RNA polymerase specialized sigma24 family protein